MANPNAAHEPSMEEILASIRQIISEDGGSSAPKIDGMIAEPARAGRSEDAAPQAEPRPIAPAPNARVPVSFAAPDEPAEAIGNTTASGRDFGSFMRRDVTVEANEALEPETEPRHFAGPLIAQRAYSAEEDEGPLLSPASGEAISGAFGTLAHTLLEQNARTLEDVVTAMLQPMLKQWLDDNLPSIVERKVREEIERVSRGRR
jgi:uncharacterized protein